MREEAEKEKRQEDNNGGEKRQSDEDAWESYLLLLLLTVNYKFRLATKLYKTDRQIGNGLKDMLVRFSYQGKSIFRHGPLTENLNLTYH